MNKRWYDQESTLSMAISLLQNASLQNRNQTVAYIYQQLQENYPLVYPAMQETKHRVWDIVQRRKTMNDEAWGLVEMLRELSVEDRTHVALEMIRYIYCLEHDFQPEEEDFTEDGTNLEAAL